MQTFDDVKKNLDLIITPQNINKPTDLGTPLIFSILENNLNTFNYLLEKGANKDLRSNVNIFPLEIQDVSPFESAIFVSNLRIIKILLNENVVTYNRDFIYALKSPKRTKIIKLFLKYNYNFKFIIEPMGLFFEDYFNSYTKTTPLIIAIKLKYFDIAKMIYDKTYLNYVEEYLNKTALDYSIESRNKEIISLLRKHGAKRSCEILKTKCEPLSPEIEKILNGDK